MISFSEDVNEHKEHFVIQNDNDDDDDDDDDDDVQSRSVFIIIAQELVRTLNLINKCNSN